MHDGVNGSIASRCHSGLVRAATMFLGSWSLTTYISVFLSKA